MAAQLQRRDERASQLEEQPTLRCSGTGSSKKRKQKQRRRPKGPKHKAKRGDRGSKEGSSCRPGGELKKENIR